MANGLQVTAVIKFLADQYADGRLEDIQVEAEDLVYMCAGKIPMPMKEQTIKYLIEELGVFDAVDHIVCVD